MPSIAESAAPLYARVAQRLAEDIGGGAYPQGSLLPPELALCKRFDVSRITLRAAIRELQMRGMVSRRPGVGTRVESATPQERYVHESATIDGIIQFTDELIFRLIDARDDIISDPDRAAWLCCPLGERVTIMRGLRMAAATKEPICLSIHVARGIDERRARAFNGVKGSLAGALEAQAGRRVDMIRQTVEAAKLLARDAALLKAPRGDAALSSWRWYFTGSDNLLLASNSLFPRGRYAWTMTVRRERSDLGASRRDQEAR